MSPTWMKNMIRNLRVFMSERLRYYVIFPKAVPFIWGLILVHSWVEYALVALLITHLADILHLPKAASVVNLLDGATAVLMLIMAYLSETYIGPFLVLLCTTTAYIFGLLLLYLGAGRLKRIETPLLYATVILVGLGRAGRDVQLKEFLTDQCRREGPSAEDLHEERVESRRKIWWRSAYVLGVVASVYLFTKAEWEARCKISIMAMAAAFVIFLLGFSFYERKKPSTTTLNNMLRLLFGNQVDTRTSRVEELKSLVRMVPLWSAFLVYGLMLATANTFFYEQTDYTANYLGQISPFLDEQSDYSCNDLLVSGEVPAIIFVIIRYSVVFVVSRACDLLLRLRWSEHISRRVMLVRSGLGLAVSPICCLVAWRVEEYRLHQRMKHAICIRFSWLIPQFVLLGLMEGLVFDGMQSVYVSMVPPSLHRYGPSFTLFALSIGNFTSLAFVFAFRHLFRDNLNFSRLGTFYKNLGYTCFANLVVYCCIATCYEMKQESSDADADDDEGIEPQTQSLQEEGHVPVGSVVGGDQQLS